MTFKTPRTLTALPLLWLAVALPAQAGTVQVSFDHPERFADIGPPGESRELLQVIDRHLQALGETGLPAGQTLQVTVTDIDLAGTIDPWPGRLSDVRVLRGGADWPRIELQYTLSQGDRVLAQGSERLLDLGYLLRPRFVNVAERLPYEQRMLSGWFAERFGPSAARR